MSETGSLYTNHLVLVVDDEQQFARMLSKMLQAEGHEVLVAHDGQTALELATEHQPCLALVDVVMPGMDGLEVCRRLKQSPATSGTTVIMVSGQISQQDVGAALIAGADDYLRKPIDRPTVRFRVQAHLQLREARIEQQRLRERLEMISRAASDAIILTNAKGAVAHWNEAAEEMFGFSRAEAMGVDLHQLIVPERHRHIPIARVREFAATGQGPAVGRTREMMALRKSGEEFPVEISLSATQDGNEWWALGIARDITARKRAEERYRALFETSRDSIVTMSPPEWRFNSGNPAAVALFGAADEADLCSRAPWEYSPPEQPDGRPSAEAALDRIQSAMQHGSSSFNWTHRRRDGTDFSAQVQLVALTLDGQPGLQATVRDVTVEQQLQTELSHARKLEAVGQLAAGIAHEINTPTQFVSDSVHFLNEAFEAVTQLLGRYQTLLDEPIEQQAAQLAAVRALEEELDLPFLLENIPSSFQRCFDGLGRITGIVRAMKEFAHPDEREKSLGDLNHALESTLVIAANEYKYVSRVETDFGDLPMVECHLSDLNQVFLNLIVNAAHAIGDVVQDSGDKGVIRVATRLDGDYARITIADTGSGIKESLRQRVFDPFFTTKPVGKGSGQGLAIARSIVVDKHGGTITVDSEVGQGTTFTIALPVTAAAPAEVAR